jgi:hypothetical protein
MMTWAVFGSSMFAYCSRGGRGHALPQIHLRIAWTVRFSMALSETASASNNA